MLIALPLDVDDVTRDGARQAAERELIKPEYHHVKPLFLRLVEWIWSHLNQLFGAAAAATPGGGFGLIGIFALLVGAGLLLYFRVGRVSGSARRGEAVFDGSRLRTAAEHRAAAVAAAEQGEWDVAVRERFRALVRALEERSLLEPRVGRTADEAAAEAAVALPSAADLLAAAAGQFDEIVYGGRAASEPAYRLVADADDTVRDAKPVFR